MDNERYIDQLEQGSKDQQDKINQLSSYVHSGMQGQDSNLIVYQLELDNILERIEHLLKGDIINDDGQGNVTYKKPDNNDLIILNDYGVQLIMNIISFYLNRNTILSNYQPERINEILYDLGNELADLVYINYEKMGLNNVEKKSRSPVLIMNILHIIESSYNRALGGNELESLRSARIVTQNQPLGGNQGQMMGIRPQQKKHVGGFINPMNWGW